MSSDFPTEKFQIHILNFFGEGDNKFTNVKIKIAEFLRDAIDDPSYNKRLLDSWFETFMVNCSDKPDHQKELTLSKNDIMLPVIILVIDPPLDESEFNKICDYDDYEGLVQEYRNIIDRHVCDYPYSSKITGDFLQKRNCVSDHNNYKYEYVKTEWMQYEQDFETITDSDKREALIKLLLLTVITRRSKIKKIKEAAKL